MYPYNTSSLQYVVYVLQKQQGLRVYYIILLLYHILHLLLQENDGKNPYGFGGDACSHQVVLRTANSRIYYNNYYIIRQVHWVGRYIISVFITSIVLRECSARNRPSGGHPPVPIYITRIFEYFLLSSV